MLSGWLSVACHTTPCHDTTVVQTSVNFIQEDESSSSDSSRCSIAAPAAAASNDRRSRSLSSCLRGTPSTSMMNPGQWPSVALFFLSFSALSSWFSEHVPFHSCASRAPTCCWLSPQSLMSCMCLPMNYLHPASLRLHQSSAWHALSQLPLRLQTRLPFLHLPSASREKQLPLRWLEQSAKGGASHQLASSDHQGLMRPLEEPPSQPPAIIPIRIKKTSVSCRQTEKWECADAWTSRPCCMKR
jgi:hypothetical protein